MACLDSNSVIVGGFCVKCISPCRSCVQGDPNSCLTCVDGYSRVGSTCVYGCPNTDFVYINGRCVCRNGSKEYNERCYTSCPAGTGPSEGNRCQNCLPNCVTCAGSAFVCQECAVGWTLTLGKCTKNSTTCSAGYALSPDGDCVALCPSSMYYRGEFCVYIFGN